jgi:putative SOS response-associated peptidase YedK
MGIDPELGQKQDEEVEWGLIPSWAKSKTKKRPFNARSDKVQTSGMYREAFKRRRCIIPADGFYEWDEFDKTKPPQFIHCADDRVFGFAGLWERWQAGEDVKAVDTCAIITTDPSDFMRPIHGRMPVILRPEDYGLWLDKEAGPAEAAKLMQPYAEGGLEAIPVRSPNEATDCIERL